MGGQPRSDDAGTSDVSARPSLALPSRPACRFAPSPNGALHLGHAYSALRNQAVAARLGGRLLLRIEDIDIARCSPEFEAAIFDDLRWLGLSWEQPVRRQSEHMARYAEALGWLSARGLLYPCFCTRGDIAAVVRGQADWPRDPDGSPLYPGTCRGLAAAERERRLAAGRPHALRLDMAQAQAAAAGALAWMEYEDGDVGRAVPARAADWGDAVLRRRDIPSSYHIAVVVDDAEQGITDIVRGRDLFEATALHRLLQELLGLPQPRYHHHRLVPDEAGLKLSKSRKAAALGELRRAGLSPADVIALIAARLPP